MKIVDSVKDPAGSLEAAAATLAAGEVVALPTDTVYGLAVRAGDDAGIAQLFELKHRPSDRQVAVLVSGTAQMQGLTSEPPAIFDRVISRLWPGQVTVVLDSPDGTVGVRCPDHPWLLDLLEVTGPLATTSANLHGDPPLQKASDIVATFGTGLGLVVDGGICSGQASTVVALKGDRIDVLREGAVDTRSIRAAAGVRGSTS